MCLYVIITGEFCPTPPPPVSWDSELHLQISGEVPWAINQPITGLPSHISLSQHTGNTNRGITPLRLSRLYMRQPNKQLPRVIIINVLQIVFYHSTMIQWIFNLLILLSFNFNNFVTKQSTRLRPLKIMQTHWNM